MAAYGALLGVEKQIAIQGSFVRPPNHRPHVKVESRTSYTPGNPLYHSAVYTALYFLASQSGMKDQWLIINVVMA